MGMFLHGLATLQEIIPWNYCIVLDLSECISRNQSLCMQNRHGGWTTLQLQMAGQMLQMYYSFRETSALWGMNILPSMYPEDAKYNCMRWSKLCFTVILEVFHGCKEKYYLACSVFELQHRN